MPIYEFRCKSCDKEFETLLLGSEANETVTCPCCSSLDLERMMSLCSAGTGKISGSASNCQPRSAGFS